MRAREGALEKAGRLAEAFRAAMKTSQGSGGNPWRENSSIETTPKPITSLVK